MTTSARRLRSKRSFAEKAARRLADDGDSSEHRTGPRFDCRSLLRRLLPAALVILAACGASAKKLDEVTFYEGPRFTLKVTRYMEKIPLHYNGEVFRVQCRSRGTGSIPAQKTGDAGWQMVGNGGAIGTKSADDVLRVVREQYVVVNDSTLVLTASGFRISRDDCLSFRSWYPTALPRELIDTLPKPAYCSPPATADCRHYDFQPPRHPKFSEIRIGDGGDISFTATSPAFKAGSHRVTSTDGGVTWTVEP